jgi:hypothetical protein
MRKIDNEIPADWGDHSVGENFRSNQQLFTLHTYKNFQNFKNEKVQLTENNTLVTRNP